MSSKGYSQWSSLSQESWTGSKSISARARSCWGHFTSSELKDSAERWDRSFIYCPLSFPPATEYLLLEHIIVHPHLPEWQPQLSGFSPLQQLSRLQRQKFPGLSICTTGWSPPYVSMENISIWFAGSPFIHLNIPVAIPWLQSQNLESAFSCSRKTCGKTLDYIMAEM